MDRVAELVLELAREHEGPRRVDPAPEWSQQAHADVAELVAEALDRDRAIRRHAAGLLALVGQVADQVVSCERIEVVFLVQPALCASTLGDELLVELATERTERAAELDRSAGAVSAPERHLPGLARRGTHDHAIARDVLDAPGGRAEDEG